MNRTFTVLVTGLVLTSAAWSANDDSLRRRGYLGAGLDSADGDTGIVVTQVLPQSPAQAAGLDKSDVLMSLGGTAATGANRVGDVIRRIGAASEGDLLEASVLRGGEEIPLTIRIASLPMESNADFETRYDAVDVGEWRQRVILTMPRGDGLRPAIAYLQGVSCSSIEAPLQAEDRIRQVVTEWTRAGFAVMRVEKSGVGDSEGPACLEIGLQTELLGYAAAVKWLFAQPGVDPQRVFLFGHSMGGVFAPLVARDLPVRGIMVFGTIGAPLRQYFEETDARQLPMRGLSGTALEREMEKSDKFFQMLLGERLSPGEIETRAPELRGFMRFRQADATHVFGRHYKFWQELDDVRLPAPWADVNVPVLAIWGMADFPATRGDHPLIVDTVNAAGKTTARFVEMPNIGHGFDQAFDMGDSLANGMMGPFNPAIIDVTTAWMREIAPTS